MNTKDLKNYINEVLGDSVRCLLPSFWWKKLFGEVVDAVESVEESVDSVTKSTRELSERISEIEENSSNSSNSSIINVTYSQLRELVWDSMLVPGSYYRITDYITKTCGGNVGSKELKFDVLVQAATIDSLYDDARALRTETGDNLPYSVKPEYWKLKYTIENSYRKYPWAKIKYDGCIVKLTNGDTHKEEYIPHYKFGNNYSGSLIWNSYDYTSIILNMPVPLSRGGATTNDYIAYKYYEYSNGYRVYKITSITDTEIVYDTGWGSSEVATWDETNGCYQISSKTVEKAIVVSNPIVGTDVISIAAGTYVSYGKIIEITNNDNTEGTGVIFEMEDEFGNKAPYDFKNLMFKRYHVSGNLITYSGYKASDPYIERPSCQIPNWTSGNVFTVNSNDYMFMTTFSLNDSQTLNDRSLEGGVKNCKLGRDCYNNVFVGGLDDGYISVGFNCKYNTICVSEGHNYIMGNDVSFNIGMANSYGNTYIGDGCKYNILFLKNSKIGNNCSNNYFELDNTEIEDGCCGNYCFRLNGSVMQNNVNNCYISSSYNALFERNISYIRVNNSHTSNYIIRKNNYNITISGSDPKNFCINEGVNKSGEGSITVTIPSDNNYELMIGRNSQGEIKMWNPADLVQ